jgi:hypothetical protein
MSIIKILLFGLYGKAILFSNNGHISIFIPISNCIIITFYNSTYLVALDYILRLLIDCKTAVCPHLLKNAVLDSGCFHWMFLHLQSLG